MQGFNQNAVYFLVPGQKAKVNTYQHHFMSVIMSDIASVSVETFSNFIPRLESAKETILFFTTRGMLLGIYNIQGQLILLSHKI